MVHAAVGNLFTYIDLQRDFNIFFSLEWILTIINLLSNLKVHQGSRLYEDMSQGEQPATAANGDDDGPVTAKTNTPNIPATRSLFDARQSRIQEDRDTWIFVICETSRRNCDSIRSSCFSSWREVKHKMQFRVSCQRGYLSPSKLWWIWQPSKSESHKRMLQHPL
ncbi:uncharacterized protein LOC128229917 [Mya arenaria]|uniref:uncharacterized protein LOC128229917 n=1 Tax=Mya arenaria TaxID=6604 RepID=UPI0022E8CDBA|nr:uncharacterized protein LOC128229917 [Mya arenaria]